MPQLTKEMYYLSQDFYCRFVVKENLAPKEDIHQIAQKCITLTSEFFAAFEATQDALRSADSKALAKELPRANSLVVESSAIAQALKQAPAPVETPAPAPLPVTKGKMQAPAPKAPGEAPANAQEPSAPAPLPPTKKKVARRQP